MINALPPRLRRASTWGWLIALSLLASPAVGLAQGTPKKDQATTTKKSKAGDAAAKAKDGGSAAKAKADAKAKAEAEAEAEAKAAEEAKVQATSVEVFKDPRAEEALTKQHPIPGLRAARPTDLNAVKAMAASSANLDPEVLQRFVEGMAYQLVDASNIKNLLTPPPGTITRTSLNIQTAVDGLIDVMKIAQVSNNAAFLKAYNALLIATLPKLLDNHLVSRIQAMIVLGQVPSAEVLPILLAQLKDPKQTVWVKLWALKGLSNLVQDGVAVTSVLGTDRAFTASQAVLGFLDAEKEAGIPWPARMRAMEALGALRQATGPTSRDKAEFCSAAMDVLADPSMTPEVRASAASALGMIQVNPSLAKYNFPVVAYWIGLLSADIGDAIVKDFKKNPTEAEYLSGLLIGPINQAYNGIEGARESGLLNAPIAHPNVAPSLTYIRQLAELDTAVARASVELVRAAKGAIPDRLADLTKRVAALREFLNANPPKDFHLIPPEGTEYTLKAPEAQAEPNEKADAASDDKADAAKTDAPKSDGK